MIRRAPRLIAAAIFACGLLAVMPMLQASDSPPQERRGDITASQIASTGGPSSIGMWIKKLNCRQESDCAQRLVEAGGKYVLFSDKGTYDLSDQSQAAQFAGSLVTVKGTYDKYRNSNVMVVSINSN
jgi:hypothetical protein